MKFFPSLCSLTCIALAGTHLQGQVVINELRIDQSSTDDDEFFELAGPANASLDNLTYLVIGDGSGNSGTIENVTPLTGQTLPASGFFVAAESTFTLGTADYVTSLNFENSDNVTHLLVEGFTGSDGQDLDTDDDGVLDVTPWTSIASSLGLLEDPSGEKLYGDTFLGPDGSFVPGAAQRNADGGYSIIGFGDFASHTPGAANNAATSTSYSENPTTGGSSGPEGVTIMQIQGSGYTSPYVGQSVQTTGVVTLVADDHFWIQDPDGDGDDATSDGLYVYRGLSTNSAVEVGDLVEVVANITEYYDLTETEQPDTVTVLSKDHDLPEPVLLNDRENLDMAAESAYRESLEGMRVSVPLGYVVGPTNNYGEFVVITRADMRLGSGYNPYHRAMMVRSLGGDSVDYNPERIMIDDAARTTANLKPGDLVRGVVGVMDYTFSDYKVVYDEMTYLARPIPSTPVSRRSSNSGAWNYKIGTFNVENLFDLVDNPDKDDEGSTPTADELETKLSKLTLALIEELELPDVLTIEETENTEILQVLADRVNAIADTDYVAISGGSSDGRGIECAILYNDHTVDLIDAFLITESLVPGTEAAFGPASASPGREPYVGIFQLGSEEVTVIANHFKSKGGDGALWGTGEPFVRETEQQRKLQAQVVRDYVNQLLAENADANIVVGGDLNDFYFDEPGEGQNPVSIVVDGTTGDTALTNLIEQVPEYDRYTYMYVGNAQVLDHLIVSPALLDNLRGQDILHVNAAWPANLEADASTPLRSSDHDPIEARFHF
ncbi:MAG: endonuclease/exonuclease/phosphatase [Puniceicoccaceae bacterium 5H]|nr:MAG: endonuclease/exonuclease/phosphatase [Puniceicoccaceae bacterium 5H]